jgi:hypothetical protein
MTGALELPAGSAAAPSLRFTGSTTTGLATPTANTLSLVANSAERMTLSSTAVTALAKLVVTQPFCNQAIQSAVPANGGTTVAAATTSILILSPAANIASHTVTFPTSPTNGQLFTIMLGTSNTITTLTNSAPGSTIVNGITGLSVANLGASSGGTSVTYLFNSATNSWIRYARA